MVLLSMSWSFDLLLKRMIDSLHWMRMWLLKAYNSQFQYI